MSDTPITDAAWDFAHDEGGCNTGHLLDVMTDLERKLTTVTDQRDALVEALDEIRALPTPQGCDPDLLTAVAIATRSLAAVKETMNETSPPTGATE